MPYKSLSFSFHLSPSFYWRNLIFFPYDSIEISQDWILMIIFFRYHVSYFFLSLVFPLNWSLSEQIWFQSKVELCTSTKKHYIECLFAILQPLLVIAWSIYISSALGGCRVVIFTFIIFFSFISCKISIRRNIHSIIICFFLVCSSYMKDKINNWLFTFSHFSKYWVGFLLPSYISKDIFLKNCLGEVKDWTDFNMLDVFQSKADILFFHYSHFVQWKSFHVCSGIILTWTQYTVKILYLLW